MAREDDRLDPEVVLEEDARRDAALRAPYDPLTGEGSPIPRVGIPIDETRRVRVPYPMARRLVTEGWAGALREHGSVAQVAEAAGKSRTEALAMFSATRLAFDYEYWAATCATIEDKAGVDVPLVLNPSQRYSLKGRERERTGRGVIREIELKGRQYGSSTEKTAYACWLQTVVAPFHARRANAYVISLDADAAGDIAARYDRIANSASATARRLVGRVSFAGHQGASNTRRVLVGPGLLHARMFGEEGPQEVGRLMLGSARAPNAPSGRTAQIALVSEIGKMASTAAQGANKLLTNLTSIVPRAPGSCLMLESTAGDEGAWFKRNVQRARRDAERDDGETESAYRFVFVSWLIDPQYALPLDEEQRRHVAETLGARGVSGEDDAHEAALWAAGATLGHIAFFRHRRGELDHLHEFQQEYPHNPDEAWATAGKRVIPAAYIATARKHVRAPLRRGRLRADGTEGRAALQGLHFEDDPRGPLLVWSLPGDDLGGLIDPAKVHGRYLSAADVGGPAATSDPSCASVLDRAPRLLGAAAWIAADWHGHDDVDRFAWASLQLAAWYADGSGQGALWAPEVNRIINKAAQERGANYGETVVDIGAQVYAQVYQRTVLDDATGTPTTKAGFHMNPSTKAAAVTAYVRAMRGLHQGEGTDAYDAAIIDRCAAALDEAEREVDIDGVITHPEDEHDDRFDTRIILAYLDGHEDTPAVRLVTPAASARRVTPSAATFG